jgi:hypothetical protein
MMQLWGCEVSGVSLRSSWSKTPLLSANIFFFVILWLWERNEAFIVFIYLSANNHRLRCGNINVFDYGGLPKTPLGMLHNIRYIHGITFLKSATIPKQFWSQDFRVKDLNAKIYKPVVKLTKFHSRLAISSFSYSGCHVFESHLTCLSYRPTSKT